MATADTTAPIEAHDDGHDIYPVRKTAMWVFLGSEAIFFGSMIATFLLYRNTTNGGPGAEIFDIPFTSASSFVLLMSSLTMVLGLNAYERHDMRQTRVWLVSTALLGATFLAGQIYEFTEFFHKGPCHAFGPDIIGDVAVHFLGRKTQGASGNGRGNPVRGVIAPDKPGVRRVGSNEMVWLVGHRHASYRDRTGKRQPIRPVRLSLLALSVISTAVPFGAGWTGAGPT